MSIQNQLLEWYDKNHRKLPFRENTEAYSIWVSEIMLQQTQMDTVIPYYLRFMTKYPSVFELSEATEEEVFKLWEGLGYYSRVRNMMKCAKAIVEEYKGHFPNQYDQLIKLPGIGPYTAGAILSIAFNLPYPAVDGNVIRVISRIYGIKEDSSLPKTKKMIEGQVRALLPQDVRHFNQALMELGAMICTPKSPECSKCPLMADCMAYLSCMQEELPYKSIKQKNTKIYLAVAIIENQHQWLFCKPNNGLLAGLWGFPSEESKDRELSKKMIEAKISKNLEMKVIGVKLIGEEKHVFSHETWIMDIYQFLIEPSISHSKEAIAEKTSEYDSKYNWISLDEMDRYPISNAYKKILKYL
jgi:A/G-specific adenine glycosylase